MDEIEKEDLNYKFPLDATCREKAKKELNETDEERVGSVRALREWALQRQDWLKTPVDIGFLLRFLRVRKFSQLGARKTLEHYWTERSKSPDWFRDIDTYDPEVQEIVGTGMFLILPGTDKQGRKICFERPEQLDVDWALKKFGMGKLFKGMMALFDWLLMDPNVQINGIIFIEDMTGFNLKHSMTIYNTENTKKMMSLFQESPLPYVFGSMDFLYKECLDGIPCRTKAMHIYNEPPIFDPFVVLVKTFLKKKLRDRIHMIGRNLTSLYEKVDMDMLPTEYLPDDYTGSKVGSANDVIAYMQNEIKKPEVRNEILMMSSSKYGVDLAKKPKDDEPQASFRKLNVS